MYIYKITNNKTNKIYIGLTVQKVNQRLYKHIYDAKKGESSYLYNSMRKHGYEHFQIEIIDECKSIKELKEKEKFYIKEYNTTNRKKGYNLSEGGDGTPGVLKSEYTRNLIRQKAIGRKVSEESRNKMSESHKKRIWTEKDKDIIRENAYKTRKPINQYDLNGNFINSFGSLKEAEDNLGIKYNLISGVLSGRRKQTYGFIFKLVENNS